MNKQAEKHLGRAEGFLARGDEYYGKAADEIIAAQKADPTLTNKQISERFGKGAEWVRRLVRWRTSDSAPSTPFSEPGRETPDVRGAKRVLREAPAEQIKQIVESLPASKQRVVRDVIEGALVDQAFPKRSESEKKRKAERNARHSLRYLEADKEIDKARAATRRVLDLSREVDFNSEETDLLLHDLGDLRALLNLIETALSGNADIDWDAELAKITD